MVVTDHVVLREDLEGQVQRQAANDHGQGVQDHPPMVSSPSENRGVGTDQGHGSKHVHPTHPAEHLSAPAVHRPAEQDGGHRHQHQETFVAHPAELPALELVHHAEHGVEHHHRQQQVQGALVALPVQQRGQVAEGFGQALGLHPGIVRLQHVEGLLPGPALPQQLVGLAAEGLAAHCRTKIAKAASGNPCTEPGPQDTASSQLFTNTYRCIYQLSLSLPHCDQQPLT